VDPAYDLDIASKYIKYVITWNNNKENIAPLIEIGGNAKYIVQKNTPKKYETKEFFSYV
jgi:hypothetical protein